METIVIDVIIVILPIIFSIYGIVFCFQRLSRYRRSINPQAINPQQAIPHQPNPPIIQRNTNHIGIEINREMMNSIYLNFIDDECPICLEPFSDETRYELIYLPCNHLFHKQCISEWLCYQSVCPSCRASIQ